MAELDSPQQSTEQKYLLDASAESEAKQACTKKTTWGVVIALVMIVIIVIIIIVKADTSDSNKS